MSFNQLRIAGDKGGFCEAEWPQISQQVLDQFKRDQRFSHERVICFEGASYFKDVQARRRSIIRNERMKVDSPNFMLRGVA